MSPIENVKPLLKQPPQYHTPLAAAGLHFTTWHTPHHQAANLLRGDKDPPLALAQRAHVPSPMQPVLCG
jgi:hypothetical protein